jgi:hypothetical protein
MLDARLCTAAGLELETDRCQVAGVAAGAAGHAAPRQAGGIDGYDQAQGRTAVAAQRAMRTGVDAGTAESAAAAAEIDHWEAAVAAHQDGRRTCARAVVAARAPVSETGARPRRAQWGMPRP